MEDRLASLIDEALGGGEQALSGLMEELAELGFPETGEGAPERFRLLKMQAEGVRERQKALAERHMAAESGRLFKAWEGLESFSWRQYAPSWSDGDTGSYHAYTDELMINGEEVSGEGSASEAQMYRAIRQVLESFGSDLLIELYGDSRTVTITPEGATSEWYWAEDDW